MNPSATPTHNAQTPAITYQVDFSRRNDHLADVTISFRADNDTPSLWLPTWIAGSYLIREFAKNITTVAYSTDANTAVHRAEKTSKNTWQLPHAKAGDTITVCYEVYCYDTSVRTAYVDHQRIFGNFTSLLLMVQNQENALCQITLDVPENPANAHAVLACGLMHTATRHEKAHGKRTLAYTRYQLPCLPAFESYDYPFEISDQDCSDFTIHDRQGKPLAHRFFVSGRHFGDVDRLTDDVARICQCYVDWLSDAPFNDYTFMLNATASDYGGLEHINSTALVSPRSDLPKFGEADKPSENYQRLLGLCSHEYFHAWWVKTVRPDVMMSARLQDEAYTPLLWVFEGFTSYVDDFMLLQAGVIGKDDYAKLLLAQINRYYQTDGRMHQSVAESSFDAWIKLYRPDENSTNQGVSYYNKGALVAWLLDVLLLTHSDGKYRLFDVIKHCYEIAKTKTDKRFGLSTETLGEIISQMIDGAVWQEFYHHYIIGTKQLPIEQTLRELGAIIKTNQKRTPWGMQTEQTSAGLSIKHLRRHSTASQSGLSAGDVIVAIDGMRATNDVLAAAYHFQSRTALPIIVHAFRQDMLQQFTINLPVLNMDNQPSTNETVLHRPTDSFSQESLRTLEILSLPDGKWLDDVFV